jgi:hypothetical protein
LFYTQLGSIAMSGFKERHIAAQERLRRQERLGALAARGHAILCWCNRCAHHARLDARQLSLALGPDFAVPEIGSRLRCSNRRACGRDGGRALAALGEEEEACMSELLEGGCQCGAVRYAIEGAPLLTALCHCSMCRRASAAPAVAWAMFAESQVRFTGAPPAAYASSPEGRRRFCSACGTQIAFTASYIPGLVDITIGSLDRPEAVPPSLHYWDSRRLPWLEIADGLPRHPEFPPPP